MLEKIISLIRFSFDENVNESISSKIRHFYDIHFLLTDKECVTYIESVKFKEDLNELIDHDKKAFEVPKGWIEKDINDSPLIVDFDKVWGSVKSTYTKELSILSYDNIPDEKEVKQSFKKIVEIIKSE